MTDLEKSELKTVEQRFKNYLKKHKLKVVDLKDLGDLYIQDEREIEQNYTEIMCVDKSGKNAYCGYVDFVPDLEVLKTFDRDTHTLYKHKTEDNLYIYVHYNWMPGMGEDTWGYKFITKKIK